jgi:hypothetical protein
MQSVAGPLDLHALARRRKRAGHELSKNRFLSAQILAYFDEEMSLWRRSAAHANETASRLAAAFEATRTRTVPGAGEAAGAAAGEGEGGLEWRWQHPVETNQLFLSFAVSDAHHLTMTMTDTATAGLLPTCWALLLLEPLCPLTRR